MQPDLKNDVHAYWNKASCGTLVTAKPKHSKEYFDEIEEWRYQEEPDIFEFAQFTRFHGKKVLEVGVGAGTDFIQWARAGAVAHGIDLTEEAIQNVRERLEVYGLTCAELRVADAENLPFDDGNFDLVYSWGVIHHTPDMAKALQEIIRVTKPGGCCKVMIYNRHSLRSISMYLKYGLLKGRPFRSLADIYCHHYESIGTKVYSKREVTRLLDNLPVVDIRISAPVKPREAFPGRMGNASRTKNTSRLKSLYFFMLRRVACLMGYFNAGFYMTIDFTVRGVKTQSPS